MRILFLTLFFQGLYFILTGLWPIAHIESFMLVTGPKTDIWLVKTVGLQTIAIGLALMVTSFQERISNEIFILAVASSLGFLVIDVVYVMSNVISEVYLTDALFQIVFIVIWIFWYRKQKLTAAEEFKISNQKMEFPE